jgi:DNA polymerase-4
MQQLALQIEAPPRHILHVNTDDFFASLARLRDPGLRRRPVIVGNLMNRGSVVSASYEARAAGVHPGLTMQQAERRLPGAALVQVDWAFAQRASRELLRVLEGYGPRIEPLGLDEAFVDYTGCEALLGPPLDAGLRLRRQVQDRLRLDVSIGVAANKLVSRFASSAAKRHSLLDVLPGYEASFVAPHPVERLPGVGPPLGRKLRDLGVPTVGDLARFPIEVLEAVFGRLGRRLAEAAHGVDRTAVGPGRARAVLEESEIFEPDLLETTVLEAWVEALAARLGLALRARGWAARRLGVRLEHSDQVRVQRVATLRPATCLDARLGAAVRALVPQLYRRRVRVRRLTLQAMGFEPVAVQLDLFSPDTEARLRRLLQAVDRVQQRYATAAALRTARCLGTEPAATPAG